MEFYLENPSVALAEHLFSVESDHMPSRSYLDGLQTRKLDASVRQEVIISILQVSGNTEPSVSYLAVNYLDRFLSSQGIPQRMKWILKLLAASCVSLATKMMETGFDLSFSQWDEGYVFDPETVRRMEMVILGALSWRMHSITPFSFFNFFTSMLALENDQPLMLAVKARTSHLIFRTQNEISLLEFRPSTIAASAFLSVAREQLLPHQCQCFEAAISDCSFVKEESLRGCCRAITDYLENSPAVALEPALTSSWNTAVSVLDQQWWSSESANVTASEGRASNAAVEREGRP